ncbi:MAG: SpoIIE family protein phosphatase [Bacteroidales bacterium]|nr:SpoIIE family protein phosphatase [Bacteroidales bacterium]
MATFSVFIMVRDGIAFKYFWPNSLWIAKQANFQFALFANIFMLIFTKTALKTDLHFPKTNKFLLIVVALLILFSIGNLFLDKPLFVVNNYLTILASLPVFIISAQLLKHKSLVLGKYYIVSFVILFSGVLIFILKNLGMVDFSLGENVLKVAFITQVLILSNGLIAMYQAILKDTNRSVVDNLKKLYEVKNDLSLKLEKQVELRTKEVDRKNEELILANRQLGAERDIFEMQRNLISLQKQQTTDSIMYAKRIQRTLMHPLEKIRKIFPESILIDIPKDIVSGDFYWVHDSGNMKYAAVADCTGHGVPGAFMSIIGITYLNEIIRNTPNLKPNEILNILRDQVINSFQSYENESEVKDGMDISLVCIHKDSLILEYAGAYNPLYVVRGNELTTIEADRMPISTSDRQNEKFNIHSFSLNKGDMIYLFTDGFLDQFGWRSGKKFKNKQFKELLLDINEMPTEVKQVVIKNAFKNWKGDLEQVDDIMILGLKI